jgi:(p)ppGpp synthase/HD superfamily hydrolase
MSDEIRFAIKYARNAHDGQKRKYTGQEYITHPAAVGSILDSMGLPEHIVVAGILHDVVEDTDKKIEEIESLFGPKVSFIVKQVTNVSTKEDGNRVVRKELDKNHLAMSTYEGATVKLADLIHNTMSIVKHDPEFAKTYLKEKRDLLEVLKHGHKGLWKIADTMIKELM